MPDGLTVNIDTRELEALLRQYPALELDIYAEMDATMEPSLALFQLAVVGETPVGVTGNLRNSITKQPIGHAPNLSGQVTTSQPYGIVVEEGRRPGQRMPPVDAIELWVRRKLGIGDGAHEVAYVIARSIGRKGTRGQHMFQKGFDKAKEPVEKLWEQVPDRAIRRWENRT